MGSRLETLSSGSPSLEPPTIRVEPVEHTKAAGEASGEGNRIRGTGYGTRSDRSQFDPAKHAAAALQRDAAVEVVVKDVLKYLKYCATNDAVGDPEPQQASKGLPPPEEDALVADEEAQGSLMEDVEAQDSSVPMDELADALRDSCWVEYLDSALLEASLVATKREHFYGVLMDVFEAMARCPLLVPLFGALPHRAGTLLETL